MIFSPELKEGRLIKRYKRFFADLETPDGVLTVHVPNTGSLKGCLEEGNPCLYALSADPKRKLKGTLQFIWTKTSWVGVNTSLPNKLVEELYLERPLLHWKAFPYHQREVKINSKSRIDLMLASSEKHLASKTKCHFIEVKNVTMSSEDCALFPDAVTERGQKHLEELIKLMDKGHSAEIFFVIQRTDCTQFSPCKEIDPRYAGLLKEAQERGVRVSAHACTLNRRSHLSLSESELLVRM